ncbi:MAG: hypothetical protein GXY58_02450 [Planctomycetaceae bacterium]|nr:hypothetical protein [Planctomycetaceae bacterium]
MGTDPQKKVGLAVSAYDRAASWVIALNILVGVAVGLAFLVWLSRVLTFTSDEQAKIEYIEVIAGRGDHAAGFERDAEPPGMEELADEIEPQVEQLLEVVTLTVSTQATALDAIDTPMNSSSAGAGLGDSRPAGPLGEGDNVIPRGERWEIRYNANSLAAYAQQLDYFGIELAAVGGGQKQIDYALNLRNPVPTRRQGASEEEKRLYMLWTAGNLRRFDQQLLRAAGIQTSGRIAVQFYPQAIEERLFQIEMAHAADNGKTSPRQIQQTVFGARQQGTGFEYFVVSQLYRAVPD